MQKSLDESRWNVRVRETSIGMPLSREEFAGKVGPPAAENTRRKSR